MSSLITISAVKIRKKEVLVEQWHQIGWHSNCYASTPFVTGYNWRIISGGGGGGMLYMHTTTHCTRGNNPNCVMLCNPTRKEKLPEQRTTFSYGKTCKPGEHTHAHTHTPDTVIILKAEPFRHLSSWSWCSSIIAFTYNFTTSKTRCMWRILWCSQGNY